MCIYTLSCYTHTHTHTQLRRIFSDFSMFVAIVTMVVIAYLLRNKVAVETLIVPANFQPSCPARSDPSWIINPLKSDRMEIWMYFAALIPAGLVSYTSLAATCRTYSERGKEEGKEGEGAYLPYRARTMASEVPL